MAKVSPVSIKYMIHANFTAEGALEKPDVIGALFGQTEGLLGSDLEMRELQKEGKIGRIEVELERSDKRTTGTINIPTALDQSETTLIAAAIETIERIGPCDAQIEVERIEDVRSSKREYILDRAKKLMQGIEGVSDSRDISNQIKDSAKTTGVKEYGKEKLPSGDISGDEIIVVEGRADVMNLLRNGVDNVIAMNGTKLPETIRELGKEKKITLFVDGDRGGKLIIQNVLDNAKIAYIAFAPDGKEVEELAGKEILMNLRKKISVEDYLGKSSSRGYVREEKTQELELDENKKQKLREISNEIEGTGKAVFLDENLEEMKQTSSRGIGITLKKVPVAPAIIVMDGIVTGSVTSAAEEAGVQVIVAKSFATSDTTIKLLSL
jgi:DNA primase